MQKITTFLMFDGNAEQAIDLYTSVFKNSQVLDISRYGEEGPGALGSVQKALFSLNGQEFMAIDSPVKHEFKFTPSVSLFVESDTEEQVEELFHKLSDGGQVLMPLNQYPFSDKFGWLTDRFGVSWQICKAR